MKTKLLLLVSMLCTISAAIAQAPQLMNYQAVVRNAQGQPVQSTLVNFKFQIHQGTAGGSLVYTETDTATTNQFGLAAIQIGSVTNLGNVTWGTGNQYLQVSVDATGGTNFIDMGTTQLLSVPYALFSGNGSGPAGATGPTGIAGNAGVTGATGPTGIGLLGVTGATGADGAANAWGLSGNSGTNAATNFIGTTDSADIKFRANNKPSGTIAISSHSQSTALGYQVLNANTTGTYNTALGYEALYSNTTGLSNAVVGNNALGLNTTGTSNSGISAWVLSANTSGSQNSAIGYGALDNNSTGGNNTAAGAWSLASNRHGTNNTGVGYGADVGDSSLTNATAIGANTVVGKSNALVLGHNAFVGIGTSKPAVLLDVENGTTSPAFKLSDGTQAAGKLLTSDTGGNASWKAAPGVHNVGDLYGGGMVFWVDSTGTHGLIAALNDLSGTITWYNGNYTTVNTVRDGVNAGFANTERMIASQGVGSDAASLCAAYNGGGYGDWYLPSKYELNLLQSTLGTQGLANLTLYARWSSTESNNTDAWYQYVGPGGGAQQTQFKNFLYEVRPIRAF